MRIEIVVHEADRRREVPSSSRRVHVIEIDAERLVTPEDLFEAMAAALDFPEYFGRNWDALYECFSDYFVIEDGGLGSEFGERTGIEADSVRIVFRHAGKLARDVPSMAGDIVALLNYTREANANRNSADLSVEFAVE